MASGQGGIIYGQMLSGWHVSAAVSRSTINKLIHGGKVTVTRWLSSRMNTRAMGESSLSEEEEEENGEIGKDRRC